MAAAMPEAAEQKTVKTILINYLEAKSTNEFHQLTNILTDPDVSDEALASGLEELGKVASLLGHEEFEPFVDAILKIRWPSRKKTVTKAYRSFVEFLVSANTTYYIKEVFSNLVRLFFPAMSKEELQDIHSISSEVKDKHCLEFGQIHKLMKILLKHTPLSPNFLLDILHSTYPHNAKPTYLHVCYVRNLLHFIEYAPQLRLKILRLIICNINKIDAQCSRQAIHDAAVAEEDEEEEEEEEDAEDSDEEDMMFPMDNFNRERRETEHAEIEEEEPKPVIKEGPMPHATGDKMDQLMLIMFNYIKWECHPKKNSELFDLKKARALYKDLIAAFDQFIIPTYDALHIQFLMFYLVSFDRDLYTEFIDYLWFKVQSPKVVPLFRQTAVYYLCGLMARAKFITVYDVRAMLDMMVKWIHKYMQEVDVRRRSAMDLGKIHMAFYSLCQSVFYLFIYRHKEILEMPDGLEFCKFLKFQTIVTSPMNPLKYCQPMIARTFGSVTREHKIAFLDTVMDYNNRHALLHKRNPLDSTFPFDPYCLRDSSVYIDPIYREYDGSVSEEKQIAKVLTAEEEDKVYQELLEEQEEEEEEEDRVEALLNEAMSTSPKKQAGFLGVLVTYGVSPGFKTMTTTNRKRLRSECEEDMGSDMKRYLIDTDSRGSSTPETSRPCSPML